MASASALALSGLAAALEEIRGPAAAAARRALRHVERDEYTDAERELRDALSRDSRCAAAEGLLGWTWALTGEVSRADASFKRAALLAPRKPWPLFLRALAWRSWNRGESACGILDEALALGAGAPAGALARQWREAMGLSGPAAPKARAKAPRRRPARSGRRRKLRRRR